MQEEAAKSAKEEGSQRTGKEEEPIKISSGVYKSWKRYAKNCKRRGAAGKYEAKSQTSTKITRSQKALKKVVNIE